MVRSAKLSVTVSAQAFVGAAFALLLVPLPWLMAWLFAALFHECCHLTAVVLTGNRVNSITVDLSGAEIQTDAMSDLQTLVCTLAGPVGGMLLLFSTPVFPRVAVCALIQSLYNLLPVYPLDGGRGVLCFLRLFCREKTACNICCAVRIALLLAFVVLGILAAYWNLGFLPLIMSVLFAARMMKIKISCK